MVRLEMMAVLRSQAGLGSVVLCCGVGLALGEGDGLTPGLVAYRVARAGAILLGFLSLPLLASSARRDVQTNASEVVLSRPQQAHELLVTRWLGNLCFLFLLLILVTIFAFGNLTAFGGPPAPGAGARFTLWAIADALLLGALPLVFLSAVGYCAADLLQNVLAAAIVALYWILVLVGRDYLSRIFDLSLSQNAPAYLLLGTAVVLAAAAVARWRQGLRTARKANLPILAAAALVAGLGMAWHFVLVRHDPPFHRHPLALEIGSQSIRCGRLPGFWLDDQNGRRVKLADYEGKTLVVAFWSPAKPESPAALATLGRLQQEVPAEKLQVVAVCLSDDMATARRFARDSGITFPMLTDTNTHWGEVTAGVSPLAEAYELSELPAVFVADPQRRLLARSDGPSASRWENLAPQVQKALAGELGLWQPPSTQQPAPTTSKS